MQEGSGKGRKRRSNGRATKGRGGLVFRGRDGKAPPPTWKGSGRYSLLLTRDGKRTRFTLKNKNGSPCGNLNDAEAARNLKRHLGRVKRWRQETDMVARWVASGLGIAAGGFRRICHHDAVPALVEALNRENGQGLGSGGFFASSQ